MALKRPADEDEVTASRQRREPLKRAKLSSSADARSNSSQPSTCSVSEDSALQSSPPASTRERISSMSSLQPTDSSSDSASTLSSDSESDLSAPESSDEIVTVGGPKKPHIHRVDGPDGSEGLKARIAAFLPQLEEANGLLLSEGGPHSMEDVEEGEQHIEMNLGLGVLEEQQQEADTSSDSNSDSSYEDALDGTIVSINSTNMHPVPVLALGALSGLAFARPSSAGKQRCVVSSQYSLSNGTADDSPAISDAFNKCANNGIVAFELGVDYNVLTPIVADTLDHVTIEMYGNLHLPQNVTYIQQIYNQSTTEEDDDLYWFTLSGPGIQYSGTPNVTTGWIYSYGQAWWDANPVNGTGLDGRPHLVSFNTTNGGMTHFKSSKPIAWGVQVHGSGITIEDTIIDAYSTTGSFPFNTDGFDVSATDVEIINSVIFNGDDAIAVQSGSHNVFFRGGTIGYQSHGMSIGSLGQDQSQFANVSNVSFDDITVIDAVYAARFKSWQGGQGLASNISWTNMRVYNVTFPIFVTQTYINQGGSQTQIGNGATQGRPNNSTVVMEGMRWENFTGTINTFQPGDGSCVTDPCWYNVGLPNLSHTEAIIVECNTEASCNDLEMKNIEVFPQSMASPNVICFNATAALNPDLGFACRNGSFVPTL